MRSSPHSFPALPGHLGPVTGASPANTLTRPPESPIPEQVGFAGVMARPTKPKAPETAVKERLPAHERHEGVFALKAPYSAAGDQPKAIESLVKAYRNGAREQTLLGVTGSGKTFTMANVIKDLGKPTLIISHNKTLAAQLYEEMKEFFPDNAVSYFVSYYDYYQPEAYVPSSDTYIAKEADINAEIEKLRHASTSTLMGRKDVIVVASVSCIYGLGDPNEYRERHIVLKKGDIIGRQELLRRLINILYVRNDQAPKPGTIRARGDVVEVRSPDGETVHRIDLFGDEVERLTRIHSMTGRVIDEHEVIVIHPGKHFVTAPDEIERVCQNIQLELEERLDELAKQGKHLEAQRLETRTRYDLEMLREVGYCNGIENYSRHFTGKKPGEPPYCLIDYFPDDFLTIIDESHATLPQLRAMYNGDRARKETLVEFGFRLPSALDNRPLRYPEFSKKIGQLLNVSATPGEDEVERSDQIVEQVVRPTGLLDPVIHVRPVQGQVEDIMRESKIRAARNERVLITTLTKRMAEDLTNYLASHGVRVRYLHSDVLTLERVEILEDLRLGNFDVLVGINLLREGLDLPEVSLVGILDADKEGFLRAERSLIQTIGRAARNVEGTVILYGDKITDSMRKAMSETDRRREIQVAYNSEHGITPRTIEKEVRRMRERAHEETLEVVEEAETAEEIEVLVTQLEGKMRIAAKRLDFEGAAFFRDRIKELRSKENSGGSATTDAGAGAKAKPKKRSRSRARK